MHWSDVILNNREKLLWNVGLVYHWLGGNVIFETGHVKLERVEQSVDAVADPRAIEIWNSCKNPRPLTNDGVPRVL